MLINKKEIVIFTILLATNFIIYKMPNIGNIFALAEIFLVLMYFLITRSLKKTFYMHTLFLLTSLEVGTIGNNDGLVYGYKSFELPYIPIAVSTLLTILLFVLSIVKRNKIKYIRNDQVFKIIIWFFFVPLIVGLVGLFMRNYDFEFFVNGAMKPLIYMCIYMFLFEFKEKRDIEKLIGLISTSLMGSVFASYIGGFLGVEASYDIAKTFPTNQIMLFSPFLLILSLYSKNKERLPILITGLLGCINILIFNSSGKGIIFVILSICIWVFKIAANHRQIIIFSFFASFAFLFGVISFQNIVNILSSNILFQSKLGQVIGLLNVSNWGGDLQNIPSSPRVRVAETLNIFLTLKGNVIDLFIGRGFGGYFQDIGDFFYGLDLTKGAFSEKEVLMGKFVNPHESLNKIFLLSGFIGVIMWIRLLVHLFVNILKDKKNSFFMLIGFLFVALMWQTYVILSYFGLICLYISLYYNKFFKQDKNGDKTES